MIGNDVYREYVEQYRLLHESGVGAFSGRSLLQYAWHVKEMCLTHQSKSILDYGCGLGEQYTRFQLQNWWGIMPTLYDPGVAALSKRPEGVFDGVIVSDVMEHIPEGALDIVINDIVNYAKQWVFFSICCRPANRILPNGQNAHITVMPKEWWLWKLKRPVKDHGLEFRVEWSA